MFDKGLGSEIIEILCKKAQEGISVRLIYDDVGSDISNTYKRKLSVSGVKHFPFMPILFSNSTSKLNYRDHRKIVVIDGNIGYVGGINLDQKYDNTFDNERYWRDTHLRIRGGAVGALQSSFVLSWNFAAKDTMEIDKILLPEQKIVVAIRFLYSHILLDTSCPGIVCRCCQGPTTKFIFGSL